MTSRFNTVCFVFDTRREAEEARAQVAKLEPGVICQLMRTSAFNNENVARLIAAQTLAARANGTLIAKKAEIDLLLRIAGTSQISQAIKKVGRQKSGETLLVVAGTSRLVRRLLASEGVNGRRLPSVELNLKERVMIENAAVLGALRA